MNEHEDRRVTGNVAGSRRLEAEEMMRRRRFAEAAALLAAHLERDRADIRALLELGICHLFNGAEGSFREIHGRVGAMLDEMGAIPAEVARLWDRYNRLAQKMAAAALLIGGAAVFGGCTATADPTADAVRVEPVQVPSAPAAPVPSAPAAPAPVVTASPAAVDAGAAATPPAGRTGEKSPPRKRPFHGKKYGGGGFSADPLDGIDI